MVVEISCDATLALRMKLMMFPLLLFVSQYASGLELEVQQGVESVLLPCQVPVNVSKNSVAIWNRDEFSNPTVHMRLQNGDDLSRQNPRYTSRTSMRADALQTGDLSLTLRNPTVSDRGTYTCITRSHGLDQSKTEVQLEVREPPPPPPPPPVWPYVLAGVLVSVVVLTVLGGCLMCRAYNIVKNRAVSILKPEEETEGAESVKLPWRGSVDLPAAVRVKWTRVQPKHGQICERVKDQDQWELHLGEDYKGRVDMNPNPVKDRDFSLTLKKPCCKDGGVYLCVVYDQDGKPLKLTIVALWVKESWWKTIARLIVCSKNPDPPTQAEKWMLTDEICEILKKSCGHEKKVEGEKPPLMSKNSNEYENAEAARLLNA